MSKKREPDEKMVLEIEGKEIDVDVYLDGELKGIRYELTSNKAIDTMDAAYCLLLIVSNYCQESNISLDALIASASIRDTTDQYHH